MFNLSNLAFRFTLLFLHFLFVNSFEYGMIAHFELKKCPDGWEEFSKSAGRVIISTGSTFDSRGEQRQFNSGDIGGEFTHVMSISEMAPHFHTSGNEALQNIYGGGGYNGKRDLFHNDGYDQYIDVNSSTTGGGKPFNIMQPYIALVACKYIKQKDEQIQKVQQEIKQILEQQQNYKQEILDNQQKYQKDILELNQKNKQEILEQQQNYQKDILDLQKKT